MGQNHATHGLLSNRFLGQLTAAPLAFAGNLLLLSVGRNTDAQCLRFSPQVIHGTDCGFFQSPVTPQSITDSGLLVGFELGCDFTDDAITWTSGPTTSLLPLPPGLYSSRAYDANDSGQIVGVLDDFEQMRPFVYQNGITTALPVPRLANFGEALGINAGGVACGYSNNTVTGPLRPLIWQNGKVTELPLGPHGVAYDVNDVGQVCGWMGPTPALSHAFVWQSGLTIDLGIPADATNSKARAINSHGDVCGTRVVNDPESGTSFIRGAVWIDGKFVDPGILSGCNKCFVQDNNDSNDIVGYCQSGPGGGAFLWRDGVMHKLFDLVPPGSGLKKIEYAWSINNLGQIACKGIDTNNDSVAVLLTPVPPAAGDVNCDWVVNIDDLLSVINGWGPCAKGSPCGADVDQSGAVNIDDLLIVINGWS